MKVLTTRCGVRCDCMKCPYCNYEDLKVLESREVDDTTIRRRRECLDCEKRFTTYERVETVEITVIKKDGSRISFDRNKLLTGFLKACEKRPIGREQIEQATTGIELDLRSEDTKEVESKLIGELVMKKLKKMDKVAYIRFASVYKDFTDIESFEKELKVLSRRRH